MSCLKRIRIERCGETVAGACQLEDFTCRFKAVHGALLGVTSTKLTLRVYFARVWNQTDPSSAELQTSQFADGAITPASRTRRLSILLGPVVPLRRVCCIRNIPPEKRQEQQNRLQEHDDLTHVGTADNTTCFLPHHTSRWNIDQRVPKARTDSIRERPSA